LDRLQFKEKFNKNINVAFFAPENVFIDLNLKENHLNFQD
jgi:hypothetical protein